MRETPLRSLKRIRDGRETPFAAGDTTGHYAPRVVENEDDSKRSRLQGDDALEKFLMLFDLVAEDEQDWECLDGSAADFVKIFCPPSLRAEKFRLVLSAALDLRV